MVTTDEKRYLIFAGSDVYPNGGAGDYIGWQFELDEAKKFANNQIDPTIEPTNGVMDWVHVFDTQTMKIVYEVS